MVQGRRYALWDVKARGYRAYGGKGHADTIEYADLYGEGTALDLIVDLAQKGDPEIGYVMVFASGRQG